MRPDVRREIIIKRAQWQPFAARLAPLETDHIDRPPELGGFIQCIHHVVRQEFVWYREVQSRKPHSLGPFNGFAQIFREHLTGEITPVQPQFGKRRIVHGGRGRVPDGRAKDRADARGGVDVG